MASHRLRELNAKEEKEDEMDMSPMIDMVFLLLIFFIVVSSPMIVKMDPEVKPAVAFNSQKPGDKNGRIVLNIRGEKEYYKLNYQDADAKMETEDEIAEYVEAEKKRIIDMNQEYKDQIKLHLRGDKEVLFEYSQTAISAAAKAGVNEIVFSVYPFAK
jgi:biopolymer transport protein ExbD